MDGKVPALLSKDSVQKARVQCTLARGIQLGRYGEKRNQFLPSSTLSTQVVTSHVTTLQSMCHLTIDMPGTRLNLVLETQTQMPTSPTCASFIPSSNQNLSLEPGVVVQNKVTSHPWPLVN